jgi:hypothetical protein
LGESRTREGKIKELLEKEASGGQTMSEDPKDSWLQDQIRKEKERQRKKRRKK